MIAPEADKMIITIALQILRKDDSPTTEMIRTAVRHVVKMFHEMNQYSNIGNVVEDQLVKEIETLRDVYVPTISTLDDMRDHQEWLSSRRAGIKWRFWERYQQYRMMSSECRPRLSGDLTMLPIRFSVG